MPIVKTTILDDDSNRIRETLSFTDPKESAMDAIAIKEAAEMTKKLVEQFSASVEGFSLPVTAVEIINQIAFQQDCILNWYLVADEKPN